MAQGSPVAFTPTPDLDAILSRIGQREDAPKDPNARGKKGEVGLYQIMPETARQYGIDPKLLTNPVVNRWVAKRYLSDLVHEFKGNIGLAVAAYNAGPGRVKSGNIPGSTRKYVANVVGPTPSVPSAKPSMVTQTDLSGAGAPTGNRVLEIGRKIFAPGTAAAGAEETVPIPPGAIVGSAPKVAAPKTVPIPKDTRLTIPGYGDIKGAPPSPPSNEPLLARAAAFLPAVGQFGGEVAGALGGAAIPGAGETGAPEFIGATSGGALGSAGGAELENVIRRHYNLPPVSVGTEAAVGGVTSGIGGLLPFVARFRKASALAKTAGISFRAALERVTQAEAELEGTLGLGARKGKLLEGAPATQVQQAYRGAKNTGLHELGQNYDSLLSPFYRKMTPNSAWHVLHGTAGKILALTGKELRSEVQAEFEAEPMTVRRAQRLRSFIREKMRTLPSDQRAAKEALGRIEKALTADIKSVIGVGNAVQLDAIDTAYSRQLQRFPEPKAFSKAYSEPAAADVILKTAKGDEARTIDMIREMRRTGQVGALQRAVSTRIWQKAGEAAASPAERFTNVVKAVSSIDRGVFDELYGEGAQKEWIDTASAVNKRMKELLAHPQERLAIEAEVNKYLAGPSALQSMTHYMIHRAFFDAFLVAGGYYEGAMGVGLGAAICLHLYDMAIHTPFAMKWLLKFATEKNPQRAARALIAFFGASVHAGGEAVMQPDATPTPAGGP